MGIIENVVSLFYYLYEYEYDYEKQRLCNN